MRVLLIDSETGWRGGQQQVALLARGLIDHPRFTGDVVTVCQPGSALAHRMRADNLPVVELAMRGPWSLSAAWNLRRLSASMSADILHANTSHAHNLSAIAGLATATQLVATRRVPFIPHGIWKYRRCARVVAISQAIAGVLIRVGVAAECIEVIPSGIDATRFQGADAVRGRVALGLAEGDMAVMCIAALEPEKGHRVLLEAWKTVAHDNPRAHLILVGDGSLREVLTTQASTLQRVHFLGFRNDIPDLLAAADVCTQPSLEEGLGTTVMDAMTCRLPVVASRAGGLPELIEHDVDGLLVPVGEAPPLAAALHRLLADPGLRSRLAATAETTARRRFLVAAMVDSYVGLYDRITRGA